MTNEDNESVEVYDYVSADTLVEGDQIAFINDEGGIDYLENISLINSHDSVMVKGYSIVTGDIANYILNADQEVGLWAV